MKDQAILEQIYPLLRYAVETLGEIKFEDKEALVADLYLGLVGYKQKEIPKFLGRLERLELLKPGKEPKYLENIKKQQDGIMAESKEKQYKLMNEIYSKWLKKLEENRLGVL